MDIIYRAFDGETFETEQECINYEKKSLEKWSNTPFALDANFKPLDSPTNEEEAVSFYQEAYYIIGTKQQIKTFFNNIGYPYEKNIAYDNYKEDEIIILGYNDIEFEDLQQKRKELNILISQIKEEFNKYAS